MGIVHAAVSFEAVMIANASIENQLDPASAPLLDARGIEVIYEGAILAVAEVSLSVTGGEVVALLGANGAGKSTTLKAISGLLATDRARVSQGDICFRGESIIDVAPNLLTRRGIVHVLEGRHVFGHLTVEENLRAGAFLRRPSRRQIERDLEEIYAYFPRLKAKRKIQAGLASGGEQQMLAIGRALLTRPDLMLLDEPSMGLAPMIVEEIFEIVMALNRSKGTSFLIAEQNITVCLRHAQRGYVLENGRVALRSSAEDLLGRKDLHEIYLGITA
jgi:branched-chain amino acid transport system ATP-binding protein